MTVAELHSLWCKGACGDGWDAFEDAVRHEWPSLYLKLKYGEEDGTDEVQEVRIPERKPVVCV